MSIGINPTVLRPLDVPPKDWTKNMFYQLFISYSIYHQAKHSHKNLWLPADSSWPAPLMIDGKPSPEAPPLAASLAELARALRPLCL